MSADMFAGLVGAAAGGAIVWFFKTTLLLWWQGAETFVTNAKAQIAAIEATIKKL